LKTYFAVQLERLARSPIDEPFMASGQYYAPANFTKYPDTETAATEEK
jgi:hypothetical protein